MIQFAGNFSINGVPETGLSATIAIRDTADGSIVENGNMTGLGDGAYKYDYDNDTAKKYVALIDGGTDTLDARYLSVWSERAKAEAQVETIGVNLLRACDLMQENFYLDQAAYNDAGALTSARLRTYSVPGSVGTDADVLATYLVTAVFAGEELQTYKVVKQ